MTSDRRRLTLEVLGWLFVSQNLYNEHRNSFWHRYRFRFMVKNTIFCRQKVSLSNVVFRAYHDAFVLDFRL